MTNKSDSPADKKSTNSQVPSKSEGRKNGGNLGNA